MEDTYNIATGYSVADLTKRVNEMALENWRPTGGVMVNAIPDRHADVTYLQAMIRLCHN